MPATCEASALSLSWEQYHWVVTRPVCYHRNASVLICALYEQYCNDTGPWKGRVLLTAPPLETVRSGSSLSFRPVCRLVQTPISSASPSLSLSSLYGPLLTHRLSQHLNACSVRGAVTGRAREGH